MDRPNDYSHREDAEEAARGSQQSSSTQRVKQEDPSDRKLALQKTRTCCISNLIDFKFSTHLLTSCFLVPDTFIDPYADEMQVPLNSNTVPAPYGTSLQPRIISLIPVFF